jgi:proteic killer suppression protein
MKFSFASNKLQRQLSDAKEMARAFGQRTKALRLRLGVLKQAKCLADVPKGPPDRCHQLTGDRAGRFAVSIKENWRLEFEPDHQPVPLKPEGGINEQEVTAIKFLGVVDYH